MIVVDASAFVDYLTSTKADSRVRRALAQRSGRTHAPHLIDLEVAHTLRRLVSRGGLGRDTAETLVLALASARLVRHPHIELLPRVWELRHNLTAYDAAYVALAEDLGATLLTADARLAAAPGLRAPVELVA